MEWTNKTIGDIAFVTKLAGFEHTKYIQGNCIHERKDDSFIPLFIGKTVRDGRIDKNFDWYIPKSIADQLPRSFLKRKCLVLPYVGTIGDLAVFDASYDALLGSNIAKIELNPNCGYSEEFIYYYLKSPRGQTVLLKDEQGGIQKNITMEAIRNVLLPDVDENNQRKIVSVLSALDDKIALNKKMNQKLEAMAKRLYDYWFVQYDFPDKNGHPYKTTGGPMTYNPTLKRDIPAGWEVKTIGDYLKIGNGRDHSKLADGPYPLYGSGGLMRYVAEYLHDGETVLFPRKGTLNNVMYRNEPLWTVDTMFYTSVLVPHSALFVFYSAKMFDFERLNTGTGVPSMTSDIIKKLPIISPDRQTLEQFDRTVVKLYNQIHHNEKEISRLSEQRDKLLPLLMNGQVEVG